MDLLLREIKKTILIEKNQVLMMKNVMTR